jgi:hypothetical protein
MGKSLTLLQSRGILICSTCDKPIVGESIMIPNKLSSKVFKWAYHTSPTECANAPDLIRKIGDEMEEPRHITELKPDYKSAMDIRGTPTTDMPMR